MLEKGITMFKNILLSATVLTLTGSMVFAAPNYNYTENQAAPAFQPTYYTQENYSLQNANNGTLKGRIVTVPAGEEFRSIVTTPLSSATLSLGQSVSLALGSDFYYNGNLIAPAGSSINGTVLEVSKAKHGTLNGKLLVRFTQIVTPQGLQIPISAVIKTEDGSGVLVGGTKLDVAKEYTKDAAIGAGSGALSGLVFGAIAGGNAGKAAAIGTAVGAGGGIVKSIWDKGEDVSIPANSSIELLLTQPITISPNFNNANY